MKTLLILRHAKSSWKDAALSDHERPLNKRGHRDAPKMGRLLREKKRLPQLIIGSSAKRVHETIEHVSEAGGYKGEILYRDTLYLGEPADYFTLLKAVDERYDRVMVVGHNPGIEEFLELLTGQEQIMPTAALAEVELPIDYWQELDETTIGTLLNLWLPRQLER